MNVSLSTRTPQNDDSVSMLLARQIGVPVRGTLLASAARTVSTATATLDLSGFRAVMLFLNISAASGTGGLRIIPEYLDPVSGSWRSPINTVAANTVSVGLFPYFFGPGLGQLMTATPNVGVVAALPLVSAMRFLVFATDATSYTYSLGYEAL
jgi:hypothetical protein